MTTPAVPGAASGRPGRWLRRLLIAAALVVLVVVVVAVATVVRLRADQSVELPADGSPVVTSPLRPDDSAGAPVMVTEYWLRQGSYQRKVAVVLPSDRAPEERLPAVILLHGRAQSPWSLVQRGSWGAAVAARRLMVLVPSGVSESWNAGPCCRLASTLGIDDVAFLDAVVTDATRRPEVDPERIYLVGESNGGIMAYRYACAHADRLAGVASVVGTNLAGCAPSASLDVIHVAATADQIVPYDGGWSATSRLFASAPFPPVPASLAAIASAEGCGTPPRDIPGPTSSITFRDWPDCSDGRRVRLVTITGGAHDWPRGSPFDATTGILDFFGLGG